MNKTFRETMLMARGALFLDTAMFKELKEAAGVFSKCLITLIIIGLLVGLVSGLVGLVKTLSIDPAAEVDAALASLDQMPVTIPPDIRSYIELGMRIGGRVAAELPAPLLPRPLVVFFQQLGLAISTPFNWLGGLLFYGALVHIFAKLLGGRASIAQMWGLTLLSAVPRLLEVLSVLFGALPGSLGSSIAGLIGLVVSIWSLVIYVRTTAIAQELDTGKAILAIVLPWVVGLLLLVVLVILLAAL